MYLTQFYHVEFMILTQLQTVTKEYVGEREKKSLDLLTFSNVL